MHGAPPPAGAYSTRPGTTPRLCDISLCFAGDGATPPAGPTPRPLPRDQNVYPRHAQGVFHSARDLTATGFINVLMISLILLRLMH